MADKKGLLIILSSPSGGGKTSIFKELLNRRPGFNYSVSATTRPGRKDEIEGESYYFLTEKEFQGKIEQGLFAEWAKVFGHYYGTYKMFIDKSLRNGDTTLMDLDIQGAWNLSKQYKEAVTIFLIPPSLKILKERLFNRGTDKYEVCEKRLEEALKEIEEWPNYNYVVVNDVFEKTVSEVEAIITAESAKSSNFRDGYFEKLFRRA